MMCSSAWRRETNERSIVTRKAALWVGVVFLLETALGGMLGYVFAHHTAMAAPAQMTETERGRRKVQRLTQELNLAPGPAETDEAIIASVQAQYKAVRSPRSRRSTKRGRGGANRFARF